MAEHEEEKGFVIKDRRRFAEGAEPEGETKAQASEERAQPQGAGPETASREEERSGGPLPEVSMATFVFSLSSSALVHLGEIPEPETNQTRVDLAIAKQIIDTLGMLQEKTKGNLDPDEESLLRSVLYDLRMRYVQKSGK
ncbi:MAG: DUF1844 domain-containing protein [Syntrophobacteraceae bacterium]